MPRWLKLAQVEEVATGVTVASLPGDDEVERYFVGSIEERQAGTAVISPARRSAKPSWVSAPGRQ